MRFNTKRRRKTRMNRDRVSSIVWSLFFSEWVSFCPVSAPGGPSELTKLVLSVHTSFLKWRTLILFIDPSLWCSQHLHSFSGSSDHSDSLVPIWVTEKLYYSFTFHRVTQTEVGPLQAHESVVMQDITGSVFYVGHCYWLPSLNSKPYLSPFKTCILNLIIMHHPSLTFNFTC